MSVPARQVPPLRILCYAVNGLGLGHLTRLVAIMRHARQLAGTLGQPCEIAFLTSSEGDVLAFQHGFPSFKIPSKTVVAEGAMDSARYRRLAKQWVWNAVNVFAPDIFVVDTFPAGAFNELFDVLDFGQKNVFIYRAVRAEAASAPSFQSALRGYHRVLLPREDDENLSLLPPGTEERTVALGQILIRSRDEIYAREAARDLLGLPLDGPAVYVSAGGGGDAASAAFYETVARVAERMPDASFCVGAGSLYRGREFHRPNVRWTRRTALMECFAAFDAALTAGGFNSVWELMHVGVPCVFVPQPRTHDDQEARVTQCARAGAGVVAADRTPDTLQTDLTALLEPTAQAKAAQAAQSLVPRNFARQAAEEILSLALDTDAVEQAGWLADAGELWQMAEAGIREADALTALSLVSAKAARLCRPRRFPENEEEAEIVRDATWKLLHVSQEQGTPLRRVLSALRRARPEVSDAATNDAAALVEAVVASAHVWLDAERETFNT